MATTKVDVNLISATGTPGSGNFLRGDGTWNSPTAGMTLVGTAVASGSSSLTITGLDSTYDTYCIALSDLVPATDGVYGWFRVGDSSGVDSGSTDYGWSMSSFQIDNTSHGSHTNEDNSDAQMVVTNPSNAVGNAAGEGMGALIYIHRPGDGTTNVGITGMGVSYRNDGESCYQHFGGDRRAVIVVDRVQFLFSSGNVATGRMTVWGLAHA